MTIKLIYKSYSFFSFSLKNLFVLESVLLHNSPLKKNHKIDSQFLNLNVIIMVLTSNLKL